MKKQLIILFSVMVGFFLFPCQILAFEHGYKSQTDTISATVRYDLAVYYDNSNAELKEYLPAFSGVTVIGSSDSWYEISYKSSSGTDTGWVTKDDFTYDCLIYDGREKQIIANGVYRFNCTPGMEDTDSLIPSLEGQPTDNSAFTCNIEFISDGCYKIWRQDTGQYLMADSLFDDSPYLRRWGSLSKSGIFILERKGDFYRIQDKETGRYLKTADSGFLEFDTGSEAIWRLSRIGGKVLDKKNMRVFTQFDADWAGRHYGRGENEDPSTNNFCTSGCGIFATVNAIYTLTGHFAKPHILADFAVDNYFRIEGYGTDSGFFKAAARKFGQKYGFAYDGSGESLEQVKKKLQKGDTVIAYVPGHYTTIVDYNKKTKKFLLYDPHYLPKRGTSSFGDWVSQSDLEEGSLMAQMFFYYKPLDK